MEVTAKIGMFSVELFAWVLSENSAEFAEKTYSLDSALVRLSYPHFYRPFNKNFTRVLGGKQVVLGKLLQSIGVFAVRGLS